MVKSWLVQDQTVLGKDYSNLLIADSLLKTIWFINAPCYGNEALASPKTNDSDKYLGRTINHDVSINDVLKEPVKAEIQSIVWVPFLQEKLADQRPPLVDTTVTMLPEKTRQPPQPPQSRRKTKVLLKKSKKPEAQAEAIDKSVQAHLKKNLPKDVPDFGKHKQEKVTKQSMPKYSTKPFDEASLKEYEQKDKLIKLIMKSKSYNTHPAHMKLYDSLMDSLLVDEKDMDKQFR
ncbi:hypothetical protein Tco_0922553 [Tanacetum coccineum]|uniref:Uncharacterized protein n=1 Tax=Tanacetum coccineum TaxID=301880 RepID=A0ABQ5CZD9_9ASTR